MRIANTVTTYCWYRNNQTFLQLWGAHSYSVFVYQWYFILMTEYFITVSHISVDNSIFWNFAPEWISFPKIKYSNIDREIRSTYLKEAIEKLVLSRVIHSVKHTNASKVPLAEHVKEDVFKTVFMDIGFVNQLYHLEPMRKLFLENY